ncbi:hypothetical protein CHS0354_013073 [Potamilus streckersoni]|uniref:Uncharacterized protein n=1 Tax=Potamilus streckersoni TaxID=2493646 RepID=A0AAE0VUC7_9BIVA|nr:hypothetical protein CHS0354_013073 [Potamilus streckersoni]
MALINLEYVRKIYFCTFLGHNFYLRCFCTIIHFANVFTQYLKGLTLLGMVTNLVLSIKCFLPFPNGRLSKTKRNRIGLSFKKMNFFQKSTHESFLPFLIVIYAFTANQCNLYGKFRNQAKCFKKMPPIW